jgi:hypothetical protein
MKGLSKSSLTRMGALITWAWVCQKLPNMQGSKGNSNPSWSNQKMAQQDSLPSVVWHGGKPYVPIACSPIVQYPNSLLCQTKTSLKSSNRVHSPSTWFSPKAWSNFIFLRISSHLSSLDGTPHCMFSWFRCIGLNISTLTEHPLRFSNSLIATH